MVGLGWKLDLLTPRTANPSSPPTTVMGVIVHWKIGEAGHEHQPHQSPATYFYDNKKIVIFFVGQEESVTHEQEER